MRAPLVRTLDPEDADSLWIEVLLTQLKVLRLAARLRREDHPESSQGVEAAAAMIIEATRNRIQREAE